MREGEWRFGDRNWALLTCVSGSLRISDSSRAVWQTRREGRGRTHEIIEGIMRVGIDDMIVMRMMIVKGVGVLILAKIICQLWIG